MPQINSVAHPRRYFRRTGLALLLALLCCQAGTWTPARGAGTASSSSQVDRILARMTLAQKIAQTFMAPVEGSAWPTVVHDWQVGGLILYQADTASAAQLRALLAGAQRDAPVPLLVATDQEGGEVSQMPASFGVDQMPAPLQYGHIGSSSLVYQSALKTGRELRALGINMDLAPVLDVLTDPNSPIGDRSYGSDPALVARLGDAAIRGYQDAGIAATAKHFLGLGGVSVDLHQGLPTVRRSLAQLNAVELVPMRAAIRTGVDALMVTHDVIPALDPTGTPASLSRPIVSGFIRKQLGYHGLIITDSLAMGGLSTRVPSIAQATVQAIAAGNDMALISADAPTIRGALNAVEHAVATGRISRASIEAAARRVLELKAKLGLLPKQ